MNATTQFRDSLLSVIDELMAANGFRRNKRSQAWRRTVSPIQTHFLHLNFGMREAAGSISVIPSIWLRDERVANLEIESGIIDPKHGNEHAQFGTTMKSIGGRDFSCTIDDDPNSTGELIYDEFFKFGIPYLNRLTNADFIIENLRSETVVDWPVASRSKRARILPLLLVSVGRVSEACDSAGKLEKDISGRDQIIPDYSNFLHWLRTNYCSEANMATES